MYYDSKTLWSNVSHILLEKENGIRGVVFTRWGEMGVYKG